MWRLFIISWFLPLLRGVSDEQFASHKSACFSCASFAYLPLWNQLMHHYFPPKNFTDRCWQPDAAMGTVACSSACFTLVEKIDPNDYTGYTERQGVMRGCVDRLLLFGLDDDVRNVLTSSYPQRVCRQTDRKLLRLFPLSGESELVTLCTCTGDHCNDQDMIMAINSSKRNSLSLTLTLSLIAILITIVSSTFSL